MLSIILKERGLCELEHAVLECKCLKLTKTIGHPF